MNNKALNMIGLAVRAGKAKTGGALCENAVKSGKAFLLIIAEDASNNTKDKFIQIALAYNVDYLLFSTCELLGKFTGNELRSVIAITDRGFKEAIKKLV